ncbi:MAG: hypothetical protein ACKVQR_22065, partial [Aquabacterium sp.]
MSTAASHRAAVDDPGASGSGVDSAFEPRWLEQAVRPRDAAQARWMGLRLRGLVVVALAGCLCLFLLLRQWAAAPYIDSSWRPAAQGGLELLSAADPALNAYRGRVLRQLAAAGEPPLVADLALLQRSPRWVVDDSQRAT